MHERRRRDDDEREEATSAEPEPLDSGTVSALRQADPHTRARTLLRLQRLHGNAAVERIVRSLQLTDRTAEPAQGLDRAQLYREAVAAELDASPYASKTERELVQDNVNTVGQIFSNYQAALHLLEEAVTSGYGETVPRALALEVLRDAAHEVFTPVLDACVGVAPGLEDLVQESMGKVDDVREVARPEPGQSAPAFALRNLVIAERQRVAATHSRLIRRQLGLMKAAEDRAAVDLSGYRRALVAAAGRLDALETGSHSAGALFQVLFDRWRELLRGPLTVRIALDSEWRVCAPTSRARTGASSLCSCWPTAAASSISTRSTCRATSSGSRPSWRAARRSSTRPGRALQFDRNEHGAPFEEDFERRLRTDGLPRTQVLSGD